MSPFPRGLKSLPKAQERDYFFSCMRIFQANKFQNIYNQKHERLELSYQQGECIFGTQVQRFIPGHIRKRFLVWYHEVLKI